MSKISVNATPIVDNLGFGVDKKYLIGAAVLLGAAFLYWQWQKKQKEAKK